MTFTADYLWFELTVSAPPGDVLDLMNHGLKAPWPTSAPIRVSADDDPRNTLRVVEEPGDLVVHHFESALERAEWVYGLVHNAIAERARADGWHRLHAALVEVGGRCAIIAGPSGAGKTGLAVRVAMAGGTVHSDEAVLVRDRRVVALPRRLHFKDSARADLPETVFADAGELPYPEPVWTVDLAGLSAAPAPFYGRPSLIVLLGDRHAPAAVREIEQSEVLLRLLPEAAPFSLDRSHLIGAVSELVRTVPAVEFDGYGDGRGVEMLREHLR